MNYQEFRYKTESVTRQHKRQPKGGSVNGHNFQIAFPKPEAGKSGSNRSNSFELSESSRPQPSIYQFGGKQTLCWFSTEQVRSAIQILFYLVALESVEFRSDFLGLGHALLVGEINSGYSIASVSLSGNSPSEHCDRHKNACTSISPAIAKLA